MLKKIQRYLLINYPLLWNLKIVHALFYSTLINLLFFIIGYFIAEGKILDIELFEDANVTMYLTAILVSVFSLIIWLIYYLKNNAFKSFYSKTVRLLYVEWLLSFIIIISFSLYSFSFDQGKAFKIKGFLTEYNLNKEQDIINNIRILLPDYESDYFDRKGEKISVSLLNYKGYGANFEGGEKVKNWLRYNKQDSVRLLMRNFLALHTKYNLKTNLTEDKWMNLVYNYPNFPVSENNFIYKRKKTEGVTYVPYYFVSYYSLENMYDKLSNMYSRDQSMINDTLLICIYMALGCSILLFSFRVTNSKLWMWTIVISGILFFIWILSMFLGSINENTDVWFFSIVYWGGVFIITLSTVLFKIINRNTKRGTGIMLNIFMWMSPCILLLFYGEYMERQKDWLYYDIWDEKKQISNDFPVYAFFRENETAIFWINLVYILVFFIFTTLIIKKWKSLPED